MMKSFTLPVVLVALTVNLLFLTITSSANTTPVLSIEDARDIPEVDFTASLTLIPTGNSIGFTDVSTGEPVSRVWNFQGGSPGSYSGRIPPPVKYNTSGSYDVSLTVVYADTAITTTKPAFITVMDYPEGWDIIATNSSHLISVPANLNFPEDELAYGDFFGVFYLDETGDEQCGGANIWDGTNNRVVVAFGDDPFTPNTKEGFDPGEDFVWKVWTASGNETEYASVTYNTNLNHHDGKFYDNGFSGLLSLFFPSFMPLSAVATATPDSICSGEQVQLNVQVTGGSGTYTFSWTSTPMGFTSQQQSPLVFPSVTTTYHVEISDGLTQVADETEVLVTSSPNVSAGQDAIICENADFVTQAIAENHCGITWMTSGDGTFDDPTIAGATYTPGVLDIETGTVELCLTAMPCDPCTLEVADCLTLVIQSQPYIQIIPDESTICHGEDFSFAGMVDAGAYASVQWSTPDGGGAFLPDVNKLASVYVPDPETDYPLGCIQLVVTAQPVNPCNVSVSDMMQLCFQALPQVFAGNDTTMCEDEIFQLNPEVTDACGFVWETAGDGFFDDPTNLVATYTPGQADLSNGSVQLCLVAQSCEPCGQPISDCIVIEIRQQPFITILSDEVTICFDEQFDLAGMVEAGNFASITWSTAGKGTFTPGPDVQEPVYVPHPDDYLAGCIALIATAEPESPCSVAATDVIQLCFQDYPDVDAGEELVICGEDSVQLTPEVNNDCGVFWESEGDGTFNDPTSPTAIYTFGQNDIASGFVQLCITAQSCQPCTQVVSDCITLTIGDRQIISIPAGWSGISGYIEPFVNDIENVMAPAMQELVIIYNFNGEMLFPDMEISTLDVWERSSGYVIKTTEPTQITLCGLDPENRTIQLNEGWNLMPVLSVTDVSIVDLFAPVIDDLMVIKEIAGFRLFFPEFGINSLEYLEPGKAYFIMLSADAMVTFP
jgi:PKD repeat protein